ncbi:MAG: cobalamin-dependent protein, partial [Clostridia bacterium]|nr:cobalamin-dependent protein [Clostridia bacterium]
TISADKNAAKETLKAVAMLTKMGIKTSLGVSNVSFGLPERDIINATFFALALKEGLSLGIINPCSNEMMKAYHAFNALNGYDENFERYIAFATSLPKFTEESVVKSQDKSTIVGDSPLKNAIIKGLKDGAVVEVEKLLQEKTPLEIIDSEIIPALDEVGVGYEKGKVYLPGLLMSADASKSAFERIKQSMPKGQASKGDFVLATVKGDIHDIGKNIVKLLLENYGFNVIDLGKDVAPNTIANAVKETHAEICGLSALMTTTVQSMEETIKLLRKETPWCKIAVGGAVMTKEYAEKIGADRYCKDAMETVRYAEEVALNK